MARTFGISFVHRIGSNGLPYASLGLTGQGYVYIKFYTPRSGDPKVGMKYLGHPSCVYFWHADNHELSVAGVDDDEHSVPVRIASLGARVWVVAFLLGIYPAVSFIRGPLRRRRRRKRGLCIKCGYNLTGNVSGVCPECAEPVPQGTLSSRDERTRA
ncbi:MAG: hypothetical protein KJ749_05290 [Planctomycetes bacterium]|nr:hypothetical protein [Planctomycetota bacterium]